MANDESLEATNFITTNVCIIHLFRFEERHVRTKSFFYERKKTNKTVFTRIASDCLRSS